MIDAAFQALQDIDSCLDVDIMEISVKQSQIVLTFFDEIIVNMSDLNTLNELGDKLQVTDVTCYQNQIFVSLRGIEGIKSLGAQSVFIPFYEIIKVLADLICTCPALEYVISKEYMKIFLDVPNVKESNLHKLFNIFKQDPFVEFAEDRPYLLYINENNFSEEFSE